MRKFMIIAVVLVAMAGAAGSANATDYRFHASCPDRGDRVVKWEIGKVDVGKENYRMQTGVKYAGCTINDYVPALHSGLPEERIGNEEAVIAAVPLAGPVIVNTGNEIKRFWKRVKKAKL